MTVSSSGWQLSPTEVLALPLDELALHVLRDVRDTSEWNEHNWINGSMQVEGWHQHKDAHRAFAEAFNWLRAQSLVARTPGQSSSDAIFVTRRGHDVLGKGLEWLRVMVRLDIDLVPVLEAKARPEVLRGELELAAFAAMREIEIAVRAAAGLPNSLIGKSLVQEAFKADGPLYDDTIDANENVATMNLFLGALGLFKNPSSHRQVDYTDPTEAIEVILLADLLLRLLAKRGALAAATREDVQP